ncbi:hypothetical protein HGRIS_011759 [Hohenbuehelia grisea]|uniref:Uncharacterized protein n=1 Tax=Hohenbuehelia grisea TaxID=104357 RepID=A0ABR3JW98_9AGAR
MATTFSRMPQPFPSAAGGSSRRRIVRFDSECVLIPEAQQKSKRPRMATKTYSVPLWKRRHEPDGSQSDGAPSSPPEESHVILKVPLLSFSPKKSRSSPTSPKPLSPCLVHRATGQFLVPSSSPLKARRPRTPNRSPSMPLPTTVHQFPEPGGIHLATIPLRACCPDCFPITEQCMKEGVVWEEKFTRGARRRRSASLDSDTHDLCGHPLHSPLSVPPVCAGDADIQVIAGLAKQPHGGFAAVYPQDLCASPIVASSSRLSSTGPPRAITVDEVDKRRRSGEFCSTMIEMCPPHQREVSGSSFNSTSSAVSSTYDEPMSPMYDPRKPSASPIAELDEDEDELFPLPSPRRSPCVSPVPGSIHSRSGSGSRSPSVRSFTPSPVNSKPPSPAPSFPPSPNGSNVCLGRGSSRDSLPNSLASRSDDALPKHMQRRSKRSSSGSERGRDRCDKGFLTPPERPSNGRVKSSDDETAKAVAAALASPIPVLPSAPSPPPSHATPKSVHTSPTSPKPTPAIRIPGSQSISFSPSRARQASPSSPMSVSVPQTHSPLRKPSPDARVSASSSKRTESPEKDKGVKRSRSLSSAGNKRRRPSFTAAAILRAGADVLKGVSSMGMGMSGGGNANS